MSKSVTELRAHTQVPNALRETQLDQGREMREGCDEMATGMAQITALLTENGKSGRDG